MDETVFDTDALSSDRLWADGAGDTDGDEMDEAEGTDEEMDDEIEEADAPPIPPRDSKEGQTQAPERDEDDLIDTRRTADEDENEDDEAMDDEEDNEDTNRCGQGRGRRRSG
jgi:hypothetical protein